MIRKHYQYKYMESNQTPRNWTMQQPNTKSTYETFSMDNLAKDTLEIDITKLQWLIHTLIKSLTN